MIKVQVGEALFYCETAREAAEIATLMSHKRPKHEKEQQVYDKGEDDMIYFVKLIKGLPSTSVSSGTLANALDVPVQGLGPKLRGISKRFEKFYQEPLNSILVREGRPGQPSVWKVNKHHLEKIDIFS